MSSNSSHMQTFPLVFHSSPDQTIAWRDGAPVTVRAFLADVRALADALPEGQHVFNVCTDRYRFTVSLCATLVAGKTSLLPSTHTPDMVRALASFAPDAFCLHDNDDCTIDLPRFRYPQTAPSDDAARETAVPHIDGARVVAYVFTSGSTGVPVPHRKTWGFLVKNVRAAAARLGLLGEARATLIGTVPPQHMYGFESTVLVALLGGAAFDADRPFYAADIAAALQRAPRPRMLVTTPFHLKMLLDSGISLPAIDLTVSATAPLSPQLAARAEAALAAPLMEIYGCTEAGQVASRRPTQGAEWHTYDGLVLSGDGTDTIVQGGHVPQPTQLADMIDVLDATTFRLLGRSNDLINIAGKRSSLSHLNYHLNMIPGVQDGAFWLPPEDANGAVTRLIAFVVAPEKSSRALHDDVLAALRLRVDAAFLPRRIVGVDALPREASTGKLPAGPFAAWAAQTLAHRGSER
jgi:acyl-coenzyme A synthetase/AMP-(fatty) acid ligase